MRIKNSITKLLFVAIVLAGFIPASAVELPSNPVSWINSPPISLQALEGKAAFLWFYEET